MPYRPRGPYPSKELALSLGISSVNVQHYQRDHTCTMKIGSITIFITPETDRQPFASLTTSESIQFSKRGLPWLCPPLLKVLLKKRKIRKGQPQVQSTSSPHHPATYTFSPRMRYIWMRSGFVRDRK
ncbi:unnamed protein product [Ectocarpus sp. 6 AP-2014]